MTFKFVDLRATLVVKFALTVDNAIGNYMTEAIMPAMTKVEP
jgi:hypothetical protein